MFRRMGERAVRIARRLRSDPSSGAWRRQSFGWAPVVGALAGLLAATTVVTPRPWLIWNVSASAPLGLYAVEAGAPARGDLVAARVPAAWRAFGGARGYIPVNVPLIKRVAALGGDWVCSDSAGIWVNGRFAAARRLVDGAGLPMPFWHGCTPLAPGEYLLLMNKADSFDGRYFGKTGPGDIIGKVELLWERRK